MARFPLLVLALLFFATNATATPYTLAPGSTTHLTVRVRATDGFTTEFAINNEEPAAIDYGGGSSEAFVQGVLTPVLFVENLDVAYGPMAFSGTIGVGQIPVSITFNSVDLSYTNMNGTLNNVGVAAPGLQTIVADTLAGSIVGFLTADGVEVPFNFSSQDFCTESFGCWPGAVASNDLERPKVYALAGPNNFDEFEFRISGGNANGMRTILVNGANIAEVGGITYSLELTTWANGAVLQVVPEPGSAALLGIGLVVLGLRRRSDSVDAL